MLIDLHTHAVPSSRDAFDGVEALAASLALAGADGAALTDHGPGCDYVAAARAFAEAGLLLVPGRELSTPLGHVLALTTDVAWLADRPERNDLPLTDPPRAPLALVWAHPAGWRVAGAMVPPDPSKGADHVHAVEVLNGERLYQLGAVALAEGLARSLGVAATGGSDAHRSEAAGRCLTAVDAKAADGAEAVVEAIAGGDCRPVLASAWAERNAIRYERDDLLPYRQAP